MKTVIQKEDVLEKAIRTRYYFDIQGILDAMQKDGLIKPDGTLYSLFLRSRAEGKDCYQTVCDILEHTEELSLDGCSCYGCGQDALFPPVLRHEGICYPYRLCCRGKRALLR